MSASSRAAGPASPSGPAISARSPGVRSDPFFFDLLGFLGTVKGEGTRRLDDGKQTDFFVGLNTLAIVLEVPNSQLGGNGRNIGVWGTTRDKHDRRLDQMGRPAINTVFNPAADKIAFNKTAPYQQPTAMGGKFRSNVVDTLEAFSALDCEGAYAPADAATLAGILLPGRAALRRRLGGRRSAQWPRLWPTTSSTSSSTS